jgi:uncharacterized caspase-like protein
MRQQLTLALGLLLLCLAAPAAFAQQNSVALLIGNTAYPDAESPLQGPVADARALADQLKRLGFDVVVGENLKKEAMRRSLDQFYGKIKPNSTALVYFGGFGIQSDRRSYLIPVDAQIWTESDVRRDGLNLDKILAEMTSRGARAKIAIVDASRRNPFERRFRSVSAGLAAVAVPRGAAVMTSAPPDTVISDDNSPMFMVSLVKELTVPDATVEQIFNRTRIDVSRATKQQQVPWLSSSLDEDLPLGSLSQAAAPSGVVASQPNADVQLKAAGSNPVVQIPSQPAALASNAQPKTAEAENAQPMTATAGPAEPSSGDASVASLAPPPDQLSKVRVDPGLIGTFTRDSVIDDYDWHYVYSIAPDGSCHMVMTQEENGTYSGGNGVYRTVGIKTGHVRTGTYRAAGRSAIEVTSASGVTAIFQPTQRAAPVNQANPIMLGIWRATVVQGGMTWTLTIQNNRDGTYHYDGRTEDNGPCAFADRQWRSTSAVTGKSDMGTYRLLDQRKVEVTGANGPTIWQRQ